MLWTCLVESWTFGNSSRAEKDAANNKETISKGKTQNHRPF